MRTPNTPRRLRQRSRTWSDDVDDAEALMGNRQPTMNNLAALKGTGDWQNLDAFRSTLAHKYRKNQGALALIFYAAKKLALLATIGILAAMIGISVNYTTNYLQAFRKSLVSTSLLEIDHWLRYTLICVIFAAISCAFTLVVHSGAIGSGIPEIKTTLSGSISPSLLGFRLLVAKGVGLIFALSAGLSVGMEGPFVHITCALADILMSLLWFRDIQSDPLNRLDVLSCACAAGVAATFGTPFGAVLFSLEITSFSYLVRNLPRSFMTSVIVVITYSVLNAEESLSLFSTQNSLTSDVSNSDLILFAALGAVCGTIGCIFIAAVDFMIKLRNEFLKKTVHPRIIRRRRFLMVVIVAMFIAPITYLDIAVGLHGDNHSLTDQLFETDSKGLTMQLICYAPFKIFVTMVSVVLPLPVGLFTPVFLSGGAIGRLMGEFLYDMRSSVLGPLTNFAPWEFAVVGAAAFATGVTRAISTAVIVFELSGEDHLRLPLGIAILMAYFIGNRFTKNIYDTLIDTNGSPYLPQLPAETHTIVVSKIMIPYTESPYLSLDSTYREAKCILRDFPEESYIPIVRDKRSRILVGGCSRQCLMDGIDDFEDKYHLMSSRPTFLGRYNSEGEMSSSQPISPMMSPPYVDSESESRQPSVSEIELALSAIPTAETDELTIAVDDTSGSNPVPFEPKENELYGSLDESELHKIDLPPKRSGNRKRSSSNTTFTNPPLSFIILKDGTHFVPVASKSERDRHLQSETFSSILVIMDPAPYQMMQTTELKQVDLVFQMLKLDTCFITRYGKLVGKITRARLREFVATKDDTPWERCINLTRMLTEFTYGEGYNRL